MLEEVKKCDYCKLGVELEFFMFSECVGLGLLIWLLKGNVLWECFMNFLCEEQEKCGYKMVIILYIGKKELYVIFGYYEKYGEDSFQLINILCEGEEFLLKLMNCLYYCEIYGYWLYFYCDLLLCIVEFGIVYCYE